jgi:putative transposase
MTSYRRLRIPGGTYFFTVGLKRRGTDTLVARIDALRAAWAQTHAERPFRTHAVVVLPDHLHAIWTLPEGDDDFPTRWRLIKSRFSRATGLTGRQSPSLVSKQERGLWQRRYWERGIRGVEDLEACMEYCRINPVKHGYVDRPEDWPFSSFRGMGVRTHPGGRSIDG